MILVVYANEPCQTCLHIDTPSLMLVKVHQIISSGGWWAVVLYCCIADCCSAFSHGHKEIRLISRGSSPSQFRGISPNSLPRLNGYKQAMLLNYETSLHCILLGLNLFRNIFQFTTGNTTAIKKNIVSWKSPPYCSCTYLFFIASVSPKNLLISFVLDCSAVLRCCLTPASCFITTH